MLSDEELWMKYIYPKKGMLNEDKTFLVIERNFHSNGLFSNYAFALQWLELSLRKNFIPVIDYKNFINFYLEEARFGIDNSWDYYFKQPTNINLEEVYKSKNVLFTTNHSADLESVWCILNNKEKRNFYKNLCKKYMGINEKCKEIIDNEYKKLFPANSKVCGILYRGTDYRNIKPFNHSIQPTIESMFDKADEFMKLYNYEYIYLATEDEEGCQKFKERFGDKVIFTNQLRFKNTKDKALDDINFNRENDRYLRGIEYLTSISLLAKCNSIIGSCCYGLLGALLLNNEYEHEYFFELELYGINN